MTQALRGELARRGVSVFAVLPGPIDTDMVRAMEMAKTSPELIAQAIVDGVEAGAEENGEKRPDKKKEALQAGPL